MPWQHDLSPDGSRVSFVFDGHLSGPEGTASAEALGRALAGGPCDLLWNVRGMTGYDAAAREAWQHVMWPNRKRIRSLKLVGGHGLVRVGATFLAVLIGVPLTTEG
jgi:hypothetical protein